jgi:hypothetical protein
MNEPKTFEISLETVNKIGAYLGEQKYNEVAHLVYLLTQLKPLFAPVAVPEVVEAKAE